MFRIKKYPKGFRVEIERSFLGFKYWKTFIYTSGMDGQVPWYYQSWDAAMDGLLYEIKYMVNRNVRRFN